MSDSLCGYLWSLPLSHQDDKNPVMDVVAAGIVDLFVVKQWGLKLAANAASTILRVDQVGSNWS